MSDKKILPIDSIVYERNDPNNIRYVVHSEKGANSGLYYVTKEGFPEETKVIYSNDYLTASEWKNFLNQEVKQLPTMIAEAPKDVETFIDKLKRDEHNGVFLIGNQKKETPHSGQPFNKPCTNNNAITAVSNKDEIYKVMQTQALIMEKQMLLLEEQIGIIKRLLPPIKAN